MIRASGILMPVFSLPSPYGIGTVGQAAFDFVDFLCECGQTYWQILPIGPTGYGDSPYQSFSAFAGNPYLIDLDLLIEQELLTRDEAAADFGDNPDAVDYGRLYKNRFDVLRHAARRLGDAPEFAAFCRAQDAWLDEYALYMAIKADCSMNAWYAWPEALRRREPDVLAAARARLSDDVRFWKAVQYLFFSQWQRLKTYANAHGVLIIGRSPTIPQIFLAMIIATAIGAGIGPTIFALAVSWWPNYARMVRGMVIVIKEKLYVESAKAIGMHPAKIVFTIIIPQTMSMVIPQITMGIGNALIAASGLSFIGLGAQMPTPEWGAMISAGSLFIFNAPWYSMIPGVFIFLSVLGFSLLGDSLQEATNPELRNI